MKWFSIAIVLIALFTFSPVKSADASAAFSFSVGFHNELSPYGGWVNYSNYGQCWRPYAYSGYRPYVDGHWAYANYGPVWYGNEAWAPYTYNYGQWIFTAAYGWIWIPGYDYHANYVDWSYGGGYIGWRPQFPSGYYYPGGNSFNLWVVVDSNHFGYDSYRPYALGSNYVRDLWDRRVFRQRYDTIDRTQLERVVRRPIRTVSLRERDIQIGNRRTRMLVTADQEERIQKHVQQVRRTDNVRRTDDVRRFNNDDVRRDNHDNVMKHKFDDIRSKEKSSKDFRKESVTKSNDVRRDQDNRKVEKNSHDTRKSYSKSKKEEHKKPEPPSRSNSSRYESSKRSVKSLESHSRKQPQPERASYKTRQSDTRKQEVSRHEVTKSVSRKPEVSRHEVTKSVSRKPEVSRHEVTKSDHGRKETRTTKTQKDKRKPPKH